MAAEVVYLGHDNSINRILKSDGVAVALTSVTRMTLTIEDKLIDSDNGETDPIRWIKSGYETGEVRLFLGGQTIDPSTYQGILIVYDPTNTNGVVWCRIQIVVYAEVEATA